MADKLTPERAQAILAIVRRYPNGATLHDIACALPGVPEVRRVRGWVETIELGGLVVLDGPGEKTIVRLTERASAAVASPPPPPQPQRAVAAVRDRSPSPAAHQAAPAPSIPLTPVAPPPQAAARPEPPAPAAGAATTGVACDELVTKAVQYVVTLGIVPNSATMLLQQAAGDEGLRGPAVAAFVDRVMTLLATLSATEAATTYGIAAAQYQQWTEHCAWAGFPLRGAPPATPVTAPPAAPPAPAAAPPPIAPHSNSRPSARPQPAVAAVRDRGPSTAPHHAAPATADVPSHGTAGHAASPSAASAAPHHAASAPVADPLPAAMPPGDAGTSAGTPLLNQIRTASEDTIAAARQLDWHRLWSGQWTFGGHTLTTRRIVVATLWAGGCLSFLQHNLTIAASAGVFSVVVVPLPFLAFLWLDRKLTWASALQAVGVGAPLLYLVGDRVRAVGEWLVPGAMHIVAAATAVFASRASTAGPPPPTVAAPVTAAAPAFPPAGAATPPSPNPVQRTAPEPPPPVGSMPAPVLAAPPPVATSSDVTAPPPRPATASSDSHATGAPPSTAAGGNPAVPPSAGGIPPREAPPANPVAGIENPASNTVTRPPPYPTAAGAYVLSAGRWVPLPHNGEVLEFDDGRPRPTDAVAMLIFSGPEDGPRLPRTGGLIVYVGQLAWTAKQLKNYPTLQIERFYPMVELASVQRDASGVRWTLWREVLPGINGIGDFRIAATLEHPAPNLTVLRPSAPLPPGRYGLACGKEFFELAVD